MLIRTDLESYYAVNLDGVLVMQYRKTAGAPDIRWGLEPVYGTGGMRGGPYWILL